MTKADVEQAMRDIFGLFAKVVVVDQPGVVFVYVTVPLIVYMVSRKRCLEACAWLGRNKPLHVLWLLDVQAPIVRIPILKYGLSFGRTTFERGMTPDIVAQAVSGPNAP